MSRNGEICQIFFHKYYKYKTFIYVNRWEMDKFLLVGAVIYTYEGNVLRTYCRLIWDFISVPYKRKFIDNIVKKKKIDILVGEGDENNDTEFKKKIQTKYSSMTHSRVFCLVLLMVFTHKSNPNRSNIPFFFVFSGSCSYKYIFLPFLFLLRHT